MGHIARNPCVFLAHLDTRNLAWPTGNLGKCQGPSSSFVQTRDNFQIPAQCSGGTMHVFGLATRSFELPQPMLRSPPSYFITCMYLLPVLSLLQSARGSLSYSPIRLPSGASLFALLFLQTKGTWPRAFLSYSRALLSQTGGDLENLPWARGGGVRPFPLAS